MRDEQVKASGTGPEGQRSNPPSVCGHFLVPYIGELPAFLYPDVIKSSLLAIDDTVEEYVYVLRRPDRVLDGEPEPFYVGKGVKRRFAFHYYQAAAKVDYATSSNKHKIHVIRKVDRNKVLIQIVPCHSENYAKELEIQLIKAWGRKNNNTGILTNMTDGGEGVSGLEMPEHVLKILSENAKQPVRFADKDYAGIKDAFTAHSAEQIAVAFDVSVDSGYCTDYGTFKAWYSYWAKKGYFPEGFNYIEEGRPIYLEISRNEIEEQIKANREAGYERAWTTKYSYPRYVVNGNRYYTLSQAAQQEDVGTPSNLAARFRRMTSLNHFSTGFNILNEEGNPLFEERSDSISQRARKQAGEFLTSFVAEPVMVDGVLYDTSMDAYAMYRHADVIDYGSFRAQIKRYKEAGVFPAGLNIPDEVGNPRYPEIDPFLISSGQLDSYVKVAGKLFPSMQMASLYYGLSHGAVHTYFKKWKQQADDPTHPTPFPKGFNVYDSRTQQPSYEEMQRVDPRVPHSGFLYNGKFFKTLIEIDAYRESAKNSASALYSKRRKAFFEKGKCFDPFLNVIGWDEMPLYPVTLDAKMSTVIARANGVGHRLHNAALAISVFDGITWVHFDSIAAAWRALPILQQKYASADSFTSSIAWFRKAGRLPDWLKLTDMQESTAHSEGAESVNKLD
ncbi:hypothetical protein [Massilia phyllosphaerae]|uniref:hypothetical protein n=1 Tax=Massilia phyllosphaerae TaxID=3106034 RepID=UPI002B1CE163|nr:hypothetical protein [Massilia sp. SGZ-792]